VHKGHRRQHDIEVGDALGTRERQRPWDGNMREGVGVFIGHRKRAAWCTRQGWLQPISDS
jgi:hypothetical protein